MSGYDLTGIPLALRMRQVERGDPLTITEYGGREVYSVSSAEDRERTVARLSRLHKVERFALPEFPKLEQNAEEDRW